MATQVIKKDGAKEPFNSEKIRRAIQFAANDAGLSPERANEIASRILITVLDFAATKDEIATSELREKIVSELDIIEPVTAKAWREHDQKKNS